MHLVLARKALAIMKKKKKINDKVSARFMRQNRKFSRKNRR